MNNVAKLTSYFLEGFTPKEVPPIKIWCDENIVLDTKETTLAGNYDSNITPYLDEVYEIMHPDHELQECDFMKGTQLGLTTLAKNCVAYRAVCDPCSMLYVLPTLELARRFSKQRITTLIENTAPLRLLIDPKKSRDSENAWNYKGFPGGVLMIGGANSAASLSQAPVAFLILDENDKFERDINNEGDPSTLAIARLDAAGDIKKLLRISSPTEKNFSHIEDAMLTSDWRKYFLPCPSCSFKHTLEWENFMIPRDSNNRFITAESHFVCPQCKYEIEERKHKTAMLENGKWQPTKPQNKSRKKRGYQLSSFYSPLGFFSWAEFAEAFADAIGPQGSIHKKRTFTNTKRAKTFETKGDRISHKILKKNIADWGEKLPIDSCLLTAGVDVQDNRLELEIVAWNQYEDTYSIKYQVIPGSPGNQTTWDKLDLILFFGLNKERRVFEHALAANVPLRIMSTCIDMGGHFTQQVLNYVNQRVGFNCFAVNGVSGQGKPIWPRKVSAGKYKLPFYSIGVDSAKETIYNRLINNTPNTGRCCFPPDRPEEYFKQLTSEEVIEEPTKSGLPRRIWKMKPGYKRNEALDCRVYNLCALEVLKLHGFILSEVHRKVTERAVMAA